MVRIYITMFLPTTQKEMCGRGWDRPDFVYVIGDAYVDHSSFGHAIISRVLESHGYRVAILSQPDFHDPDSITMFGEPRLGFLVSAGNMDSMVNHYTVAKKRRQKDAYTPGGVIGKRPDYATIVYCNLIRQRYKNIPILIGGIEASLRRLAHYDYWSDKLRRSILLDSGADLLMYGMGELSCVACADALAGGLAVQDITYIPGTVYKTREPGQALSEGGILLPTYQEMQADKAVYAKSFGIQLKHTDAITAKPLIECYGEHRYVVQNPPSRPLTQQELDAVYELPYMNAPHPSYQALGGVPAIEEIKFSLTSNRGCFGGCSFCALTFHQGRVVQARSHASLLREAEAMTKDPAFKGYIHDVGGPTANFRAPACKKQLEHGVCQNRQCLYPSPCKNLVADHSDYVALLLKLRALPGVKKVFIRSGIRFDYVLADKDNTFLRELCKYHVSGQLRVAPEHVSDHVLRLMGKPSREVYEEFLRRFDAINASLAKKQYAIPYLISSHPGSTLDDAIALAEAVRDMGYMPEQVQDFYPTPSTVSTCMYYTGIDPRTGEHVDVVRNPHEKAMQRALIQYRLPENHALVLEALRKAGREDLIGFSRECLIPPRLIVHHKDAASGQAKQSGTGSSQSHTAGTHGKSAGSTKPQGHGNSGKSRSRAASTGQTSRHGNGKRSH